MTTPSPIALFDSLDFLLHQSTPVHLCALQKQDFEISRNFLLSYRASLGTFNSYRREVERLLQWTWLIAEKSLLNLRKSDIEKFVHFCQQPPTDWINLKKPTKFIEQQGQRVPNPQWRPFVTTLPKSAHQKGHRPETKAFALSNGAIRELLAILGSFFNFLVQSDYLQQNPVALLRQKNQFLQRRQSFTQVRRLTPLQWDAILETVQLLALEHPERYERTLFMLSCLYAMYLRISELAAQARWTPQMNHFYQDRDGLWWFVTVGKGNKQRQIAVSDAMLSALKRWRQYLGLNKLPSPVDQSPLLPKQRGKGAISSITYIREQVQQAFDHTALSLQRQGLHEEAEALQAATVHWLRHTGISEDVKTRPREHVRDDAGHSSSAITDKYIDIELRERHLSAKKKPLVSEH
jgi:site-specific recombinase XerD